MKSLSNLYNNRDTSKTNTAWTLLRQEVMCLHAAFFSAAVYLCQRIVHTTWPFESKGVGKRGSSVIMLTSMCGLCLYVCARVTESVA